MSEQNWTDEPWEKDYGGTIGHIKSVGYAGSTPTVCRYDVATPSLSEEEKQANGHRIPTCINACTGVPSTIQPGAVKAMAEQLNESKADLLLLKQFIVREINRDSIRATTWHDVPEIIADRIDEITSALALYNGQGEKP